MFRQALTAQEEKELFSRLERTKEPLVFDKHFFIPDWSRLGEQSVNMMNIVREPVARIISFYYFSRKKSTGLGLGNWKRPQYLESWFNKDFESCVREEDPECQVGLGGMTMQVTFFCGSHIQCANSTNPRVLQAAKYNLENR